MNIEELASADVAAMFSRAQAVDPEIEMAVQGIEQLIRRDGDSALLELTKRLDGVGLREPFLTQADWDELASQCPADVKAAIDGNLGRIKAFHQRQVGSEDVYESEGITLGRRPIPFSAVGCYVPGGRAQYPSSVLMTVVPAVLAGVKRIIVATPPTREGKVTPAVAYAAKQAGATDILVAGGAQAIFALALGTKKIPPVQAIVGPGNAYVTTAKRWVESIVKTDAPAGPSELVVMADETAPAAAIAWDLLAQAEHDPDARVVLVTNSRDIAEATSTEIERLMPEMLRAEIIAKSMANARILLATSIESMVDFVNDYAPEHLEIMTAAPAEILPMIRNAGSIFLGPNTPVSLGDYGSGTNHVLPTMGHAILRGGLSVDDFRKWITWQEATPAGLAGVASDIVALANAEGLSAHAQAVTRRLEDA